MDDVQGSFRTKLMGSDKKVTFKIKDSYEVVTEFRIRMNTYNFHINKWKKTDEIISQHKKFAILMLETFSEVTELFGKILKDEYSLQFHYGKTELLNMIKYAMTDVFRCIEEIIEVNPSVIDYALCNREVSPRYNDYKAYIHSIACDCIIDSKFINPDVSFPLVEFVDDEPKYHGDTSLPCHINLFKRTIN